MSGDKLLLDTNVVIYHLAGNKQVESLLEGSSPYISGITFAELLAGNLNEADLGLVEEYLNAVHVVHTNDFICQSAAQLRRKYKIKLPDAIIAATSIFLDMPLVALDSDFDNISELDVLKPTV